MSSDRNTQLILGSGSPRRLEVLAQLGVKPTDVRPPDIDETPHKGELPRPYCVRMAREKVVAVTAELRSEGGSLASPRTPRKRLSFSIFSVGDATV